MTSVVELFPKARKLCYDARSQLRSVENNSAPSSSLYFSLDELENQLRLLEGLIQNEPPGQREIWRRKVNELRVEGVEIRNRGKGVEHHRYNEQLNMRNREELLSNAGLSYNQRCSNMTEMDTLVDESRSLEHSSNVLVDIISQGSASLSSLVDQKNRMKGVKRVILDMATTLGVSNSTMRIIERRDVVDKYIVYAGMGITVVVIWILYRWL